MARDHHPATLASAPLDTLDTGRQRGTAELRRTGDALTLVLATDDMRPTGGYLEVWLINEDLERMVSVGVMPAGAGEESFPVSQELIDEGYVIVDISQERFDDRPEHSGESVVRGPLRV